MCLVDEVWRGAIMVSGKYRFNILLFGTCGMLLLAVLGAPSMLRWLDAARGKMNDPVAKKYNRVLAEGLQISKHGCYGIDFVKCGSCRLEKRKTGPLTFGGLNVLAIDDLKVVLPPKGDEWRSDVANSDGKRSAAHDVAKRLGVSDGFLKNNGLPLKFSGLRIKSLAVDRLQDYNNRPEKVFSADSGEAVRDGLLLSGCTIFTNNSDGKFVGKAMLSKSGDGLRLSWRGGELEI